MEKYNVSDKTIQRAFKKLNLIAENHLSTKYIENTEKAIFDYSNGMSIIPVCNKYLFTPSIFRNILKEKGIYRNEQPRYKANFNYFEKIDNEHKAYWLGFIYADGCVKGRNSLSIRISEKDKYLLEKFLIDLDATYKISFESKINKLGKQFTLAGITISNNKFFTDLNFLGVVPRKTKVLKFPNKNQVPYHLIPHFIRGYFDGDGCITFSKKSKMISFVGTENFLIELREIFHKEIGLTKTKFTTRRLETPIIKTITWGGNINAKKIYNYLYKDATIFLDRKRDRFLQ